MYCSGIRLDVGIDSMSVDLLIVDDEDLFRRHLRFAAEALDLRVEDHDTGIAALEYLRQPHGGVLPRAYFVDIFLRNDSHGFYDRRAVTPALNIYDFLLRRRVPLDQFYFMTMAEESLQELPPDLRDAYRATGRRIIYKNNIELAFPIMEELARQKARP